MLPAVNDISRVDNRKLLKYWGVGEPFMTKENVKLNRNKRSIIANGAAILSNAVGVTLGPAGSNVLVGTAPIDQVVN